MRGVACFLKNIIFCNGGVLLNIRQMSDNLRSENVKNILKKDHNILKEALMRVKIIMNNFAQNRAFFEICMSIFQTTALPLGAKKPVAVRRRENSQEVLLCQKRTVNRQRH